MERLKTELEDSRRKDKELETKYKHMVENHASNYKKLQDALDEQRKISEYIEQLKTEMQEKINIKREKLQQKYNEQNEEIKKTNETTEKEYKRFKVENEKGIMSRFFDNISSPFRTFAKWFFKKKSSEASDRDYYV